MVPMTEDRAQSYSRLMDFLRDVGSVKLQPVEQDRVRAAADTLVLATEGGGEVEAALRDIDHLTGHLVDSGRWELEAAERLARDVADCGPELALA
jgi:hypothetical protein